MNWHTKQPLLPMRNLLFELRYFANSPRKEYGGFDDRIIQVAQSAHWHIKRMQRQMRKVKR